MKANELMRIFKGLECLAKGIDFSDRTLEGFITLQFTDEKFVIEFDDESKETLKLSHKYVVRDDCNYYFYTDKQLETDSLQVNTVVNRVSVLGTIKLMKELNYIGAPEFEEEDLDPEFADKMQKIADEWDYKQGFDCEIKDKLKISDTDLELRALLAMCQYPEGLAKKMYDAAIGERAFVLKAFKDFPIHDNRIYIPLSKADKWKMKKHLKEHGHGGYVSQIEQMNAIVISKNLIDYFYCSYGNSFQSCFALNSPHRYWYGYLPFNMAPESFIIYGTTGEVHKTTVISGNKFHCPDMRFRCWAYADKEERLLLDKRYYNVGECNSYIVDWCINFLKDKFGARDSVNTWLYKNGEGIVNIHNEYTLSFFSDSLNLSDVGVMYNYACGDRHVPGTHNIPWAEQWSSLISLANSITTISPTLDLGKKIEIVNGSLINPKKCPITNLYINADEEQHKYAKYFSKPSTNTAVCTYVGGYVFLDEMSSNKSFGGNTCQSIVIGACYNSDLGDTLFIGPYKGNACRGPKPVKIFKDHIKGHIKDTDIDAILLRVVEDDKVTMQVFKKK
jgi:hypothetical protein